MLQLPGCEPCLSFPICEADRPWCVLVPPARFSHGWRVGGWAREAGPPPRLTRLRRPSFHEPEDHCPSVTGSTSFFQTSLNSERPMLHTHSEGFAEEACKSWPGRRVAPWDSAAISQRCRHTPQVSGNDGHKICRKKPRIAHCCRTSAVTRKSCRCLNLLDVIFNVQHIVFNLNKPV